MYLQSLVERLSNGLARLPVEVRTRHADYLRAAQGEDGGFPDRQGGSDLYYTAFGLRGLAVLGELTPEICARAAPFLRHSLTQQASVVDFFSLLYACLLVQTGGGPDLLADSPADWPERVAATLETFRTTDGGYAKATGSTSGSTYHTFLVGLCYQLLGRAFPQPTQVLSFIRSRQREDGGFVELAPMRRSGTNPAAAAVGTLQLVEAISADVSERVADFLAEMPSEEGGFRANGRAPLADLLSTFTGLWTLGELGALDRVDTAAALEFAHSLELPGGGFRGGLWDSGSDVEYTFYGLGALALLA
jgi:geranylgeranyl transferase type-2 subunit beta